MKTSETIAKVAHALCRAQAEYTGAIKDATNPHFNSKFANHESVFDCIQKPFASNGLCYIQGAIPEIGMMATRIIHESGEFFETYVPLDIKPGANSQAIMAAVTYAKRNGLQAAAGVPSVDEDDDGETAVGRGKTKFNDNKSVALKSAPSVTTKSAPLSKPLGLPIQPVTATPLPGCRLCEAPLVISSSKQHYYCPNYRDESQGKHTTIAVKGLAKYIEDRKNETEKDLYPEIKF